MKLYQKLNKTENFFCSLNHTFPRRASWYLSTQIGEYFLCYDCLDSLKEKHKLKEVSFLTINMTKFIEIYKKTELSLKQC